MKRTHVVSYTPREGSNTRKLLDIVLMKLESQSEVDLLDLTLTPPDLMDTKVVTAYDKRNLKQLDLTSNELKALEYVDTLTERVANADNLVLAYPLYNYFLPGVVKLWIDNVTQAEKAFHSGEYGPEGLWTGKRALVINTSNSTPKDSARDFASPYIKYMLNYWGITDINISGAFAIKYTGLTPVKAADFKTEIEDILSKWK